MTDLAEKPLVVDDYEVKGVLGEGGTGIVYDAVRKADGKAVALKVMHRRLAGDAQIRGRFQREAAILRRLEGEHVCPILDFGEAPSDAGSLLYLVLPKIDGVSLADEMSKGLLDVDRALGLMRQILDALGAAHAEGVIHRDLKPANVLLERGYHAIVVDFGMSKIVTGGGTGTTNLTTHNMVFGTPEYMSPEQARGDDLDARCDVYAAGILLYEMLTGAPPFTGTSPLNVLTAHLTSDLDPPSTRPAAKGRVTPALEAVVMRALARDREARFPSATAFSEALARAKEAPDDAAGITPERLAFAATLPAASAEPVVDANAATLVSVAPIAPPPSSKRAPAKRRSSAPPPPAPAGSRGLWILVWILVAAGSIGAGVWFALRQ